jgi:hypothetical protein
MGFFYVLLFQEGKILAKKNASKKLKRFVGRAGFEPAKFTQQIYSLPSLAA